VKLKSMIATGSSGMGALAIAMTGPGAIVLIAIVLAAAVPVVAICWVVSDNERARRLAMIIGRSVGDFDRPKSQTPQAPGVQSTGVGVATSPNAGPGGCVFLRDALLRGVSVRRRG